MIRPPRLAAALVLSLAALWSSPHAALAQCAGASPMWTAASPDLADVEACVMGAASGDTIMVPAGTAAWSSALTLPEGTDLEIIGAGIGATSLDCESGVCFEMDLSAAHRIASFTLTGPGGCIESVNNNEQSADKHFRVDHNRIVSTDGWQSMEFTGASNGVHPQGIVDNNELVDVAVHSNGTNFGLDEADYQHVLWAQRTVLGDSDGVVYIESNAFEGTDGNINWADSNYAGRYVFRFNTGRGRGYLEVHSVQGLNRASQRFEIYGNTFTDPLDGMLLAFIRGGTGVVFGNRLPASLENDVWLDNVRSEGDPGEGVGQCDGTSAWDQNSPGASGYACRDQIGRAYDTTQWSHSPAAAYTQVLQPLYFWDNLRGTEPFTVDAMGLETWIAENRDYYKSAASFDGTSGVGSGPVASRPATCTAGVAYWATDEGDWDATRDGPDGRLYVCSADDTWTLAFTPYPFPHPWRGEGTVPPPPVDGGPGVDGGGPLPGVDGGRRVDGGGTGGGEDDGGCGCRVVTRGSGAPSAWLGAIVLLAGALRRRRG